MAGVFDATQRKATSYAKVQKLRWLHHRNRGVSGIHCKPESSKRERELTRVLHVFVRRSSSGRSLCIAKPQPCRARQNSILGLRLNRYLWSVVVGFLPCLWLACRQRSISPLSTFAWIARIVGLDGASSDWQLDWNSHCRQGPARCFGSRCVSHHLTVRYPY